MTRLEIRLLPASQIIGYLLAEYDAIDCGGGIVEGDGWTARFFQGEPFAMRPGTRVPVLFIEVDGEHEREVSAFLSRMTMRGGG